MNKLRLIIVSLGIMLAAVVNAQSNILSELFKVLDNNTLESDVILTVQTSASENIMERGKLEMRGEQFKAELFDMIMAFDGKTFYNYSFDTEEVTLSIPTKDELKEINPILFAKELQDVCTVTQTEQNGLYQLQLVPKQSSEVQKFLLTVRKQDMMPLKVVVKESATKQTVLQLNKPQYTQNKIDFRFSEAAYINDIR